MRWGKWRRRTAHDDGFGMASRRSFKLSSSVGRRHGLAGPEQGKRKQDDSPVLREEDARQSESYN